MSDEIQAEFDVVQNANSTLSCRLRLRFPDNGYEGTSAKAELCLKVEVQDHRPVHREGILATQPFTVRGRDVEIVFPLEEQLPYEYSGNQIRNDIFVRLDLGERGWIRKKKRSVDIVVHPPHKPHASGGKEIVEPEDSFSLFKNLKALNLWDKLATLGLLAVACVVITVNTCVGIHDQTVPESETYFYAQTDSDGDSTSPLLQSGVVDALIGAGMWFLIRRRLRRYMSFHQGRLPKKITKSSRIRASTIVRGKSRVDLKDATLRLVACNLECGEYIRGSGTDTHTVSFSTPIRAMILYEKTVPLIRKKDQIQHYFDEDISFAPLFQRLYPPCMASDSHGVNLHWEAQLIHPDFVDQELKLPTSVFAPEDFYGA